MGRRLYRPSGDQTANYVRCRTFGHMMDDIPSEDDTGFGDPLWVRCQRCGTERHDGIGSSGQVVYRRYVYPEGYKDAFRHEGDEPPSRSDYRMLLLQQRIREARGR